MSNYVKVSEESLRAMALAIKSSKCKKCGNPYVPSDDDNGLCDECYNIQNDCNK